MFVSTLRSSVDLLDLKSVVVVVVVCVLQQIQAETTRKDVSLCACLQRCDAYNDPHQPIDEVLLTKQKQDGNPEPNHPNPKPNPENKMQLSCCRSFYSDLRTSQEKPKGMGMGEGRGSVPCKTLLQGPLGFGPACALSENTRSPSPYGLLRAGPLRFWFSHPVFP